MSRYFLGNLSFVFNVDEKQDECVRCVLLERAKDQNEKESREADGDPQGSIGSFVMARIGVGSPNGQGREITITAAPFLFWAGLHKYSVVS